MDPARLAHHLAASLEALKSHDLARAQKHLDDALSLDYENQRVLILLKCVGFWRERQRFLLTLPDNLEKCGYLLQQWSQFQAFSERLGALDADISYALRQLVFGQGLNLMSVYNNGSGAQEPEILYLVGVCLKGIGNYDAAQRFLEKANSIQRDSPAIMADLADSYAMVGETDLAKVLFREAFFIDPQAVRLETLESGVMTVLINEVRDAGYTGPALAEWIPVYGQIKGILTIKRELRAVEYGKLRQTIYTLEREYQEGSSDQSLVLPRLINRYFWLMDYYMRTQDDNKRIQEILLKIRSLAPQVHDLYTK